MKYYKNFFKKYLKLLIEIILYLFFGEKKKSQNYLVRGHIQIMRVEHFTIFSLIFPYHYQILAQLLENCGISSALSRTTENFTVLSSYDRIKD